MSKAGRRIFDGAASFFVPVKMHKPFAYRPGDANGLFLYGSGGTKCGFCLCHQAKAVDLPGVLGAGGEQVNAGGVDAAVAQHVGQHGDVVAGAVKGAGKQVPQVVRVHLAGGHAGQAAKGFHLGPDLPAANAAAAPRSA